MRDAQDNFTASPNQRFCEMGCQDLLPGLFILHFNYHNFGETVPVFDEV